MSMRAGGHLKLEPAFLMKVETAFGGEPLNRKEFRNVAVTP